jgi:TonB family protein
VTAKKEKFGKFVLLEQVESSSLASEHRAAKLGATGLEKVVSVHRLAPRVAADADVAKSLMDQVKFASQLHNPNILKIHGIGKVDSTYYISYEFMEGKSLKAIFSRCRQDAFPFSVDHALLIASKVCSALEYAHARKSEAGTRYFHGLVCPANVLVSYEGEVRLRGFGYWPSRIREAKVLAGEEVAYLAPEQAAGGVGDTRSDIFALGAILFETLTGEPLRKGDGPLDVTARLSQAKLQSPSAEDDALPKPIAAILQRALAPDPASRYGEVQEMRKAIDTLLFSGDFTPTTFNLAFFMHSLFREDIEKESKVLKDEKDASYAEYVAEEPSHAAGGTAAAAASAARTDTQALRPPVAPGDAETTIVPSPVREAAAARTPAPAAPASPSGIGPKAAASRFTFHREGDEKSRLPLIAGVGGVLLVAAAVGMAVMKRGAPAPPSPVAPAVTTLSPQAVAAEAKVKELQERLAALEAEKAAAEAKAAEDAKKKMEAQAAARGQAVDPAALARAQEEARRKAQAEQERKAEEEKKRLEAEKAAEEARVAEEKRKAEEEAARIAAATATTTLPPTTTLPSPPPTKPGSLVTLSDVGVIAPVLERRGVLQYPPLALRQRVEGTVELNVLVDEKGGVADVQVVAGAGGRSGLNEAAMDYARRQRYRPATKDGVLVKVWMPLRVKFELPE